MENIFVWSPKALVVNIMKIIYYLCVIYSIIFINMSYMKLNYSYLKSTRRAICTKLLTFEVPIVKLRAHFIISTMTEISQNGKGPYSVLKNPPTEKQLNKTCKVVARMT